MMEDYLIFSESNCPSYIGENYNFLFNIFSESENLLSLKNKINPKTEFATSATKSDSHLNLNFDNNKNIFDNNLEQKNISIDKNMQFINKKKRRITKSGLHNKFADDNLRRKCKHLVLKSLLEFINGEIERRYKNNIGKGILKTQSLNGPTWYISVLMFCYVIGYFITKLYIKTNIPFLKYIKL